MLQGYKKPIVEIYALDADIVTASPTRFGDLEEFGREDVFDD